MPAISHEIKYIGWPQKEVNMAEAEKNRRGRQDKDRLAKALRANLARRKEQRRKRDKAQARQGAR
jgi:hypothetical protein